MKVSKLTNNIEFNIIFFSLLLNTLWEGLHSYFYLFPDGLATYPHYCWLCVGGDILIALGAFFLVSLIYKSRKWILKPTKMQVLFFVLAGVIYTVISEFVHVNVMGTWQYSDMMPMIPVVDIGLSPVVQWIIISLVLIFVVRRQVNSRSSTK